MIFLTLKYKIINKKFMARNEKIVILKNEIEANIMESTLKESKIPNIIVSYYDTAYDGLWQLQRGWGHIEAPGEYRDRILKIYNDISKD